MNRLGTITFATHTHMHATNKNAADQRLSMDNIIGVLLLRFRVVTSSSMIQQCSKQPDSGRSQTIVVLGFYSPKEPLQILE